MIGKSVAYHRKRRQPRMSAAAVAQECERLGYPALTRGVIANLESGARDSLSVPEWLTLAAALRVPPLLLLWPVGRMAEVEPLPDVHVPPLAAVEWAGDGHMVGVEPPFTEDAEAIAKYLEHGRLITTWAEARHAARRARDLLTRLDAELSKIGEDRRELEHELREHEQAEQLSVLALRNVRESMERAGIQLPSASQPLPVALARQLGEEIKP